MGRTCSVRNAIYCKIVLFIDAIAELAMTCQLFHSLTDIHWIFNSHHDSTDSNSFSQLSNVERLFWNTCVFLPGIVGLVKQRLRFDKINCVILIVLSVYFDCVSLSTYVIGLILLYCAIS